MSETARKDAVVVSIAAFENRRHSVRLDLQRERNRRGKGRSGEVVEIFASVRREDRYFAGIRGYRRMHGLPEGGCRLVLEGSAPHVWLKTAVIVGFKQNGQVVASRVLAVRDLPAGIELLGEAHKGFNRMAQMLGICEPGLYLVVGESFSKLTHLFGDTASVP